MPNYVRHNVVIRGNKEDIARCYEQITKGEDGFSFNNIIPMPESLHVTCGSISAIADVWRRANDEGKKEIEEKKKLTDKEKAEIQQIADNIAKYGYPTWYEWSIDKWGTKWDACGPGCDHDEEEININFDTAWSTPLPVFKELSKQFLDLVIYVEYADEDMGYNCGTYALFKGDIQTEDSRDYEFACDIWGIDPEPEEEED